MSIALSSKARKQHLRAHGEKRFRGGRSRGAESPWGRAAPSERIKKLNSNARQPRRTPFASAPDALTPVFSHCCARSTQKQEHFQPVHFRARGEAKGQTGGTIALGTVRSVSAFLLGLPLFELLLGFGQVGIRAPKQSGPEGLASVLAAAPLVVEIGDAFFQGLDALGKISGKRAAKSLFDRNFEFLRRGSIFSKRGGHDQKDTQRVGNVQIAGWQP